MVDVSLLGSAAVEAVKLVANPSGYLIAQIAEATSKQVLSSQASRTQELGQLRLQAERQELEMRIAEAQAKVAQELAIAKRIENASEVEIEEFYEYAGDAKLGVKASATSVAAELAGAGKRVAKRVYRFKGSASPSQTPQSEA